jgi:hypothetical protein
MPIFIANDSVHYVHGLEYPPPLRYPSIVGDDHNFMYMHPCWHCMRNAYPIALAFFDPRPEVREHENFNDDLNSFDIVITSIIENDQVRIDR